MKEAVLAIMLWFIFAFLPAVDVMAETVTVEGWYNEENNTNEMIGKNASAVIWDASRARTLGTGNVRVSYSDNIPQQIGGNVFLPDAQPRGVYPEVTFNNGQTIEDFDHWKIVECSLSQDNAATWLNLSLRAVTGAAVSVSADPEEGGEPAVGKDYVSDEDKAVSLRANSKSGYKLKKWTVVAGDITIDDEEAENTTFSVNSTTTGQEIKIKGTYEEKTEGEYTISFYPNYPGKGVGTPVKKQTTDHKISEYPKFSRSGYDLKGFYTDPEGGDRVTDKEFTKDTSLYAHWDKDKDDPDSSSGSDDENENNDNDRPAVFNPLALIAYYYENNVINHNAVFAREEQGPAAMLAFTNALPKGWKLGFSFSLSINGKNEKTLKNGTIKMYVPADILKKNRQYAIMALDKNGQVKMINDADNIEQLITASPNTEGYAYALIYKD